MNNIVKKLAIAATTAASTALLATTVAIETAAAATFKYKNDKFAQTWTFVTPGDDPTTVLSGAHSDFLNWEISYGDDKLPYDGSVWEYRYELVDHSTQKDYKAELTGGLDEIALEVWDWGNSQDVVVFLTAEEIRSEWETVPEPSAAIALSILGLGAVASRLRRRS